MVESVKSYLKPTNPSSWFVRQQKWKCHHKPSWELVTDCPFSPRDDQQLIPSTYNFNLPPSRDLPPFSPPWSMVKLPDSDSERVKVSKRPRLKGLRLGQVRPMFPEKNKGKNTKLFHDSSPCRFLVTTKVWGQFCHDAQFRPFISSAAGSFQFSSWRQREKAREVPILEPSSPHNVAGGAVSLLLWSLILDIATHHLLGPRQLGRPWGQV